MSIDPNVNPNRRARKMKIKTEVGALVATTAHEGANLMKFGLKAGSNLAEALYIETQSLVHSSRMDGLLDQLEASVEAIEALSEYGHSKEDIAKEVAILKEAHIVKVRGVANNG